MSIETQNSNIKNNNVVFCLSHKSAIHLHDTDPHRLRTPFLESENKRLVADEIFHLSVSAVVKYLIN
jgi:hypothetical protein